MSGDNMHGTQPDIRYSAEVEHHEEWKLKDFLKEIPNWEQNYLKDMRSSLSKQQIELLEGRGIKSNEGMVYGQMYNDWKQQRGVDTL